MKLADAPRRLRAFARDARREGAFRLAAEHARRRWQRLRDDRIEIWELKQQDIDVESPSLAVPIRGALWIGRYAQQADVPAAFFRVAAAEEGPEALERFAAEFDDAGVLWVAWLGTQPAGYQWTRRGDRVNPWHFPLGADTTLIFSVVTFRPFRGQRIAARTMAEICRREIAGGGRAIGECFAWNIASSRTFQSVRFRKIAMGRPYPGYPD